MPYRQAVMYARKDVEIDPGPTGYWMDSITVLLAPLLDAARRYALAVGEIHADETPLPVLAPGNGRTKTGCLWVYVCDVRLIASEEPVAVRFACTPDRPEYALNRWPAPISDCRDRFAKIDNLGAERALRGVALPGRNYLFAGAGSGERAAAMFSLIGTTGLASAFPRHR